MQSYEIMYIIKPETTQEVISTIKDTVEKIFLSRGGDLVKSQDLGLKDLAYEIDHHKKGYYVYLVVKTEKEAITEFTRVINITEDVLRHIVVKEEQ
ncbi:MAG: 30S ribosomal protein S6 [Acholeplasmatales bacterium]|jgi:small subunit ribosomal protein S6|nr:30S ribosomal protein S6 [Acholeplasmatales bacterium]